tara:strand:+ start:4722 stop:4880 length:159 start_codon:yes stop_codon:yes gene_type:complete
MPKNKWEITIIALRDNGYKYKVTKRYPSFSIAETKFFSNKEDAKRQLEEWLN